jgi:hypothetical protein
MPQKNAKNLKINHLIVEQSLAIMLILIMLLGACSPISPEDPNAVATQTTEGLDLNGAVELEEGEEIVVESATPGATSTFTITPLPSFTPTLENTPIPEATATLEQTEQDKIRAEILATGLNLDNLAASTGSQWEWMKKQSNLEGMQSALDNGWNKTNPSIEVMVVMGLTELKGIAGYNNTLITNAGWRFLVCAEVAYKQANGDWTIAKIPLEAYHEALHIIWLQYPTNTQPWIWEIPSEMDVKAYVENAETRTDGHNTTKRRIKYFAETGNYLGPGAFFGLDTSMPEVPENGYGFNSGEVEPPRYSEEDLKQFRLTGDPSLIAYLDPLDNKWVFWPWLDISMVNPLE